MDYTANILTLSQVLTLTSMESMLLLAGQMVTITMPSLLLRLVVAIETKLLRSLTVNPGHYVPLCLPLLLNLHMVNSFSISSS